MAPSDGAAEPRFALLDAAYRAHGHSVLRRAYQILGDEAEAREASHEVFMALAERPERFLRKSSILTWLYSATTHRCLNRLRDRKTRSRLLAAHAASAAPAGGARAPADQVVALRELLAGLPDELAAVAVYYYGDEMTHDEIAEVMACSPRHVGNLLARLRARVVAEAGASP